MVYFGSSAGSVDARSNGHVVAVAAVRETMRADPAWASAARGLTAADGSRAEIEPFLRFVASAGSPSVFPLPSDRLRLTIGRSPRADVVIRHDPEISRVHALLERLGGSWFVVDDGMSSNGSYVNEERVENRRRLAHLDKLRVGNTTLEYNDPAERPEQETQPDPDPVPRRLSARQRAVLVELARPLVEQASALPASNREIAARLELSEDAVRAHLRRLVEMFDLAELHPDDKRVRLAELVRYIGVLSCDA